MTRPVLLVVSRSAAVREVLETELAGRYGRDYAVVAAASPTRPGRPLSRRPARRRRSRCCWPASAGTIPRAWRCSPSSATRAGRAARARARWGDWRTARPIFDALALGRVDRWLLRPEETPDEEFHRR